MLEGESEFLASTVQEVLHHEATLALSTMFRGDQSEEEVLKKFFKWMCPEWHYFKSHFRPDGLMSFEEFENYVHWERKWAGDCEQVFKILDKKTTGYITMPVVLDVKRWFEKTINLGEFDLAQFRRKFGDHFGNLGRAWRLALDKDDRGFCCFNSFARVCHQLGLHKKLRSTWIAMTEGDANRPIRFEDLDPFGDSLIGKFVTTLVLQYGSLRQGWEQIIQDGGGHLRRSTFVERCDKFGIEACQAKWLFSVLDRDRTRYLTCFDKLTFLSHWDPGPMGPEQPEGFAGGADNLAFQINRAVRSSRLSATLRAPRGEESLLEGDGTAHNPFKIKMDFEPFNVEIVMSKKEYQEYQSRAESRQLMLGIDLRGEAKVRMKEDARQKALEDDEEEHWHMSLYHSPKEIKHHNWLTNHWRAAHENSH